MNARALAVASVIALGGLVLAAAADAAGPPIMTLDAVQIGMHCTVASVIRGTDVTTFDARIDDVLRSRDLASTRFLISVSGPAIDATGIGPGFSGSPITCTGADGIPRIAGAVSEGIGEFGGKRGLATPIESILGEPADPPASARVATAFLRRARPLSEPLTIAGLAPPLGAVFAKAAQRAHRTLVTAPATALAAQAPLVPPAPFVPGSAVAVSNATGDISSGAIGTIAYVDGDKVWAFGHELDGAGRRSLTLSTAFVSTVVSNPVASGEADTYKLASPLTDVGTITQDGVNGVAGRVGALPRRYPLRVVSFDIDRKQRHELDVQMADERPVGSPEGGSGLPVLAAGAAAQAAYTTLQGLPAQMSGRVCMRVSVAQRKGPLEYCNTYVGVGGGPQPFSDSTVVSDIGTAAQLLDAYEGPLAITGVRIGMRLTRALRLGTLVSARGPSVVRRGTTARVTLTLRRAGGGHFSRTIGVYVPRFMPAGLRDLLLTGTAADGPQQGSSDASLADLFAGPGDAPAAPATLKDLVSQFAAIHQDDGLGARFVHVGAKSPVRLPGGAEGIAERRRVVFRSDQLRIAGRARVRLLVR